MQFTLTRALSVLYWQHLVYAILTTSLLGFAASGTVLHLSPRLKAMEEISFVRFCFGGFGLTSVLAVSLVSWLAGDFFSFSLLTFDVGNVFRLAASYLASALPFFFFGLFILGLFQRHPKQAGALYAGNLLGSGAGSLLYLFGIGPLGAVGLIQFAIFLPSALVTLLPGPKRQPLSRPMAFTLLFALVLTGLVSFSPDRHKQYWTLASHKTVELSEWNPISRVDVIRTGQGLHRHILIDGDAQTVLVPPSDRVLKDIKYEWSSSDAKAHTFSTAGWKELGLLAHLETNGSGPRDVILHLDTAGTRHSIKVSLPANRPVPVFVSWRTEDRSTRLSVDYNPFQTVVYETLSLGDTSRIVAEEADGKPFRGSLSALRVWDKALDRAELLGLSPGHTGYERLIGSELHRLETGRDEDHVLVIGNGGGADSVAAARSGAKRITAVEVNPTSYYLTKTAYRDYLGDFFSRPNVTLVLEDGRSFVRRATERFDRITLVGVDSFAAASSGAYVLAESFLYTDEALADYWEHLTENGRLQISRWHFPMAPRETFRIFTMAHAMLTKKGAADPSLHLAVVAQKGSETSKGAFATLILSKQPFSAASLDLIRKGFAGYELSIIYHPLQKENSATNPFAAFVTAAKLGQEESYFQAYPFNVRPVADDNPFFFQYGKFSHLFRPYAPGVVGFDSILGRWPFFILLMLLVQCVLGGAGLVIPVWLSVRPRPGLIGSGVGYFACLGVGFMFVEMYLVQKLVLVLGHPMYSLGVTIPALLGAAALGSFLSDRLCMSRPMNRAALFGGIALLLALFTWALPFCLTWALSMGFAARTAVCAALIFPVGVALGMPFPSGLRLLKPELIPLAWAVNGAFTVLASVVAVVLAMQSGFSSLMWAAAALYASAAWLLPGLSFAAEPSRSKLHAATDAI